MGIPEFLAGKPINEYVEKQSFKRTFHVIKVSRCRKGYEKSLKILINFRKLQKGIYYAKPN